MAWQPKTTKKSQERTLSEQQDPMKELADNLKEQEKEVTPLNNTDKVFQKDSLTNDAFDTEQTETESITLEKPEGLNTENVPSRDSLQHDEEETTVGDTTITEEAFEDALEDMENNPALDEVEEDLTTTKQYFPEDSKVLKVKRLTETATLPTKAYHMDEGWDLYADEDFELKNGTYPPVMVSTGIAFDFPEGIWGQIEGRSGLAVKGIFPAGGIIDNGYKGEVKVILHYTGLQPKVTFKQGDKIAQLVLRHHIPSVIEEVSDVGDSQRGEKGFGSSGS